MHPILKLMLLVYASGLSAYLAAAIFGILTDKRSPMRIKVAAILCAPIWPIITAIILYNRRSN